MDAHDSPAAINRIDRLLREELVVWLSSVRPDGRPHLVPIWFSWDGREIIIASKPNAQKIGYRGTGGRRLAASGVRSPSRSGLPPRSGAWQRPSVRRPPAVAAAG